MKNKWAITSGVLPFDYVDHHSKNTHLLFEDNFDSNMPKHISVYSLRYPLSNSLTPEPLSFTKT